MQTAYLKLHDSLIKNILGGLPKNTAKQTREFTSQFYAKVMAPELERLETKHAVSIALSAYDFMQTRKPGEPKIRVFTPKKIEHGYSRQHTTVEVINDDMPFLLDSLAAELTRLGFSTRETFHPIFQVQRDAQGKLKKLADGPQEGGIWNSESLIHFEISTLPEGMSEKDVEKSLLWVLDHVRAAVKDWKDITAKAEFVHEALNESRSKESKTYVKEVQAFMAWLMDKSFVFLGYADYDVNQDHVNAPLSVIKNSRLGVMRVDSKGYHADGDFAEPGLFSPDTNLIEITKSSNRSPVHRPVPMDMIILKRHDKKGNIVGEIRFLGLFTSNVYYQSGDDIPMVRKKIRSVLKRANFDPVSHDGKSLKAILEFLPRDEIFQTDDDDLFEITMGILALEARPGVRMFVRKDTFERFVSVMIFVPREQFSTELRRQIQSIVEKAFKSNSSTFSTLITEDAPLARLHLITKTKPGDIPYVRLDKIETEIAKRAYLWNDLVHRALMERHSEKRAQKLFLKYNNAFSQSYINRYDPVGATYDIDRIEKAFNDGEVKLDLYRDNAESSRFLHLKTYNPNEAISLSDILPMLENSGFDVIEEYPFSIAIPETSGRVRIRDFKLEIDETSGFDFEEVKHNIEDALIKVWKGELENDGFNALILRAGLDWRKVTVLRACSKYLKQVSFLYSQQAQEQALSAHPKITALLADLFDTRFNPEVKGRDKKQASICKKIEEQLGDVHSAVEDRILRRYMDLTNAILRTNFYQKNEDGIYNEVVSFKIDSCNVPELPLPRPYREIFVYSTRVEGIHLRGGKVARGGLRWSDRAEDFRTEVLGLMKAQMVKNSVIVPVGSKGGFVLKQPPQAGGREAMMEEGIACYKMYLSAMLDITDNIKKGKIMPPKDVVRHDEDDPYLVVAADKGTATFSDIANSVSAKYDFWLGDAFASGGSVGYDHKKMGITARGAWVSVVRHFQEMGVDIDKEEFTVVGIGDMSGDVFGNGMLLSKNIQLVAAFNHLHIFIDPTPDAKKSYAERQRLFKKPRSAWTDYNEKLISKGGGVYERSAKTISLSKEAQKALSISKSKLTPDELINELIKAPVDLLWNGGIGTYVKSEEETHEQVGDRANNAVRADATELECKIVGEGGNLGFTQKGRIEYARNGGRINTDAIDNSAGVDCSDHEVNIKIAFRELVADGKLPMKRRDKILMDMTDEVARLVLKDNTLQTQAITIAQQQSYQLLESHTRLMHALEKDGRLNRDIEFLPSDKELAELRANKQGLTRPEISVLLAYSKMKTYDDMLASSLPDENYFVSDLERYFPAPMQKDFDEAIKDHRLRREIIATVMTNSIVNRAGIHFVFDMVENLGASVRDIAAAYAIARDAFGLRDIWNATEASCKNINPNTQAEIYMHTTQFLERVCAWLLLNLPKPLDISAICGEVVPAAQKLQENMAKIHSPSTREEVKTLAGKLTADSTPRKLAESVAALSLLSSAPDIISVASRHKKDVVKVGTLYSEIGEKLGLHALRRCANSLTLNTHWERLAVRTLIADFYAEQRRLTDHVLECCQTLDNWLKDNKDDVSALEQFVQSVVNGDAPDIPQLMVTLRQVRAIGVV